ncbi:MAG TPA: putative quinol monooxygenase [Myxococcota bacterium]|jgi:quinol monooxygenase YgiN|nr:putative quinol monooxygenase [Myxococcota bacterium]
MLAVIATLEVKEGKESEFESVMKELAAKTLANESGCKLYALHRKSGRTYVMLERYIDRAALATHSASEHFRSMMPRLMPCLAGAPKIETMEEVS